jgi:exodeoxyribonuclease VII large subunit
MKRLTNGRFTLVLTQRLPVSRTSLATDIISVSELNRLARQALEHELPLRWIAGEVSNLTRAASGHVYFSLKDENAQVRCVMFRSRAQLVPWQLANGQQIEARASASLYEPRGDFQLTVEAMRRAGLGRLYEAFARLKTALEAEGLFAAERKRALPLYPRQIGIISSPQAAALQDVLTSLRRRAPHVPLVLYPTPVQGEGAARQITHALTAAARDARCDVLLLVRGGGNIEDLWSFNEEIVARAIAASPIPVIAGVGHETDTTMADFVADLRAATPTAAAEIASAAWFSARAELDQATASLCDGIERYLQRCQQRLDELGHRLIHPQMRLTQHRERLQLLESRLRSGFSHQLQRGRVRLLRAQGRLAQNTPRMEPLKQRIGYVEQGLRRAATTYFSHHQQKLDSLAGALAHLNPAATVARGYAIVRDQQGAVVTSADQLSKGDEVSVQLAHGEAFARIEKTVIAPK